MVNNVVICALKYIFCLFFLPQNTFISLKGQRVGFGGVNMADYVKRTRYLCGFEGFMLIEQKTFTLINPSKCYTMAFLILIFSNKYPRLTPPTEPT